MKLLVVLSQVNYMPDNYNGLLAGLLDALKEGQREVCLTDVEIIGCASLKTLDSSLIKTILKLPFIGVFNLPKQLIKNIFSCLRGEREDICKKAKVPHLDWESMNTPEAITWVRENNVDLVLNLRTRCIYNLEILRAPKLGCINIHHGILPNYRGTFCDLYALFEKRPAGFTIHKMAEKVDAGVIFKTQVVDDGTTKNYSQYLTKTIPLEVKALIDFIEICKNTPDKVLPAGEVNKPTNDKAHYTKNPTPKKIREFKKAGIIL